MFRTASVATDCTLLQSDTGYIRVWYAVAYSVKLTNHKARDVTFVRKMNAINYDYKLCEINITRTDCIKDLEVFLDSELLFHHHVDYIFAKSLKMLKLIQH